MMTDAFGNRCDRLLRIHIRNVAAGPYDLDQGMRCAQRVYGPCGVRVEIASLSSVSLPAETAKEVAHIDMACAPGEIAAKQNELFAWFGVQDFASVTVFLVSVLNGYPVNDPLRGCAMHSAHRPAVYLSALAHASTLAHELGHLLLASSPRAGHTDMPGNVMIDGGLRGWTDANPRFDAGQILLLRKHPCLLPC
jgi:hypothetical protein